MKLTFILLIITLVALTSCGSSNNSTVRAKDVITNIVIPVSVDTTIYNTGDTVWVNTNYNEVMDISHSYETSYSRLYVLEF